MAITIGCARENKIIIKKGKHEIYTIQENGIHDTLG